MKNKFNITFLLDKKNDWIESYIKKNFLKKSKNYVFKISKNYKKIKKQNVVFILNYTKILPKSFLIQNRLNLVVHASNLPKGKGFAPIQWQIIEGKSEITLSLVEAVEKVDSGDIFLQTKISFDGSELYEEIREKQAKAVIKIINDFLNSYPQYNRKKQFGIESFYPRRKPEDGELDISKSIEANFNLLRVGNNDAWPSFFYYKGKKYILKIFKG